MRYPCSGLTVSFHRTGGFRSSGTAVLPHKNIHFQNHTQPIPCEQYDEVCGQSQLFRKFASLSYQWDVDKIDQTRYGWLASVENEQLLLRLKKLSKKDLELLTLLFVDGYRQIDVARLWHCSRSAVAQRFKKIKKFLLQNMFI